MIKKTVEMADSVVLDESGKSVNYATLCKRVNLIGKKLSKLQFDHNNYLELSSVNIKIFHFILILLIIIES